MVRQFAVDKGLRNNADYFATAGESCVSDDTHEADIASAVDQAEAPPSQRRPNFFSGSREGRISAGAGAAKYANPFHRIAGRQNKM